MPVKKNKQSKSELIQKRSQPIEKAILIIGDWIIDEYWFLARHQSETSSFVGYNHFKISSEPGDIICDLCGAGHTVKTIHRRSHETAQPYHLYGFGLWNAAQTDAFVDLLQDSLTGADHFANARFGGKFNLRDCPTNITIKTFQENAETIKTQRFYRYSDGQLEQLSRVDWDRSKHQNNSKKNVDAITDFKPKHDIVGIVIHDLAKGVISEPLIAELRRQFPGARWYVRTKNANQKWLVDLNNEHLLSLNFAGPETTSSESPWNKWIVGGKPTRDGMDYLKSMPGKIAVAVSKKHEVIMRSDIKERCIVGTSSSTSENLRQLGWSSSFFSDFAFEMIRKDDTPPRTKDGAEKAIKRVIRRADNAPRIIEPHSRDYVGYLKDQNVGATTWADTQREWDMSHADRGIIESNPTGKQLEQKIELWRASSVLPNYIACIDEKRNLIKRIGNSLSGFKSVRRPSSPLNILLTADPGAGKTSLVKALAGVMDYAVIQSNITQMLHRDELVHLFDEVAAQQANNSKPILVFVDEVNALLDSQHVFSAFLAPLEDGAYVRQGRKVSLKPCVWVFVGTAGKFDGSSEYTRSDKYSDFLSRMTMVERMDYEHLKRMYGEKNLDRLEAEARLEQVYLGLTLLRHNHPDLVNIERRVVDTFFELGPDSNPARLIRRRAGDVRAVQEGTIRSSNCKLWGISDWSAKDDLIEIR